ncbi:23S rRNA (uracil(1939)-C(5))-methyltransferase RlmD [Aeromonas schubertii]|uniref:23S rRNA (uracil(1939)-C(5))-methyltransferase RlmD n=1 Tax=Aeromonas TaxID=642 RepID=UPI00067E75C5|nr:23S rRNA (uracil(1939)-C(5))-methyltransferase RlmD [Aeromonas schubertii]KUE78330.1 23S rRNA methyltransferase [Aeromonas schubertii]QCG47167.1 23S rRNA (uracil(1939)-C(5))-methyltransferase RlmD [Aeromonas schubertii]
MAQFFTPKKTHKQPQHIECTIDTLDHHCVGVGRHEGKAVFVEGTLPGERVKVLLTEQKKQYAHGQLQKLITPAPERIEPFCPHYRECGGCSTQHMSLARQHETKQQGLRSLFSRLGGIAIPDLEPVMTGPDRAYRRVCRLAIKFDKNARRLRLGFRRRQSSELVEISACPVLEAPLSALIAPLRELFGRLKNQRELGHVELLQADDGLLMLLRHTGKPNEQDRTLLMAFAEQHKLDLYLQDGSDRCEPLRQTMTPGYRLGELSLTFAPGDFIQVNRTINDAMVARAMEWLDVRPTEKVLDLFCGVGNFTLPLAALAREVVGVEGEMAMVQRAQHNATGNGIDNVRIFKADLAADITDLPWAREGFDLVLLDPARPGALEVMPHVAKLAPRRVVYVSCNPVSLARDSKVLTQAGYRLERLGMLDMFPHTGHLESIALFVRE